MTSRKLLCVFSVLCLTAAMLISSAGASSAAQIPQAQVVSTNPVNFTPQIQDGNVQAIVQVGSRMIVGGTFTTVRNQGSTTNITRNRILAFNATTGVVDTAFNPNANGTITSIVVAPDGNIIVAGSFTNIAGAAATRIAKLNATTGARITAFTGTANGSINDMVLWGTRVIIGGGFTSTSGQSRNRIAALDSVTGAATTLINVAVAGMHQGGSTNVAELDVSPDGTKLLVIGNFTTVAGLPREQIAMLTLSAAPAVVSAWQTNDYVGQCADVFNTYMRDVEFSTDGAYFVVATTGAGYFPETFCDTATRWESNATGDGLHPTWVNYSGGDTLTQIAITGSAVYIGGHQRWMDNGIVGDVAAEGAVSREGLAALDPLTGVAFNWNPTRARGVGVFAFLATPDGLWVGHDTQTLGHETHNRIGMFPLAGGTTPPVGANANLPGNLYNAPGTVCSAGTTPYLYRVNTGGPGIAANDCGPVWAADTDFDNPLRTSGSNTADWGASVPVNGSVPATTPAGVFNTERWSPSDSPTMLWSFPATLGASLEVRLYFTNQYDGTSTPGTRVFNVTIDGAPALTNYDIAADVGNKVGVMKSFNITSDGSIDIDFTHVVENPLINAIEIVNTALLPGPQPIPSTFLQRRSFDGTTLGSDSNLNTPGVDWSQYRGTFYVNGRLYAGNVDGHLYRWNFTGTTLGPRVDVSAAGNYVLGPTWLSFSDVSGMFWYNGRLYYTRTGDPNLHFRFFSVESELYNSQEYTVSGPGIDGYDWSGVKGLTEASDDLYFQTSDGALHAVEFTGGVPIGPVSDIGSIGTAGSNGLFLIGGPPVDTQGPTTPGTPTGTSPSNGTIQINWTASTDASPPITYRVYRDGNPASIGGGTATSFTDLGLTPGTSHTYTVDAVDSLNNPSAMSGVSASIVVTGGPPAPIFADDFSSGNLSAWTQVTRTTIDNTIGSPAPPSARVNVTNQTAFAAKDTGTTTMTPCFSVNVNVQSGTSVDLFRLRTAANGPIIKVYVAATTGIIWLRADFGGTTRSSSVQVGTGWHSLELCGTVGSGTTWDLVRDGITIVNDWAANTGTAPVGRVQIGDTAAGTFAVNFDNVRLGVL